MGIENLSSNRKTAVRREALVEAHMAVAKKETSITPAKLKHEMKEKRHPPTREQLRRDLEWAREHGVDLAERKETGGRAARANVDAKKQEILDRVAAGETNNKIYAETGISTTTIVQIKQGKR